MTQPRLTVMFDIDGTLVQSYEFDEDCYIQTVQGVLEQQIDSDWSVYQHVTDSGLLMEVLNKLGRSKEFKRIQSAVKSAFINNISAHLRRQPCQEIPGAAQFLGFLSAQSDIKICIATGGWRETALLKLESAGIDTKSIPLASSNDHFIRTEIMQIAQSRLGVKTVNTVYFGDAEWDKKACRELGFKFVLVGDRVESLHQLNDFASIETAMSFISQ